MFDPIETLTLAQIRKAFDYLEPDTLAEVTMNLRRVGIRSAVTVAELADEALVANVGYGTADMLRHFAEPKQNAAEWLRSIGDEAEITNPPSAILHEYVRQAIAAHPGGFLSDATMVALFARLGEGEHADERRLMLAALPSLAAEFHDVLFAGENDDTPAGDGNRAARDEALRSLGVRPTPADYAPIEVLGSCVYCSKPIYDGLRCVDDDGEASLVAHGHCYDDAIETERKLREEERSRAF